MKRHITTASKKTEIRMLLNHPSYRETLIAIVEGDTDVRLFRDELLSHKVSIEAVDGKPAVFEIFGDLYHEHKLRLIAICDADFHHINECHSRESDVVFTDHHDIEVTLISSKSLEKVLREYAKHEHYQELKECLLDEILSAGEILGALRMANEMEELFLNFRNFSLTPFVSVVSKKLYVDEQSLVDALLVRSTNKRSHVTPEYLVRAIYDFRHRGYDKLQICCGHDLAKLIMIFLWKGDFSNRRNLSDSDIESALRLGYTFDYFKNTKMYHALKRLEYSTSKEILANT